MGIELSHFGEAHVVADSNSNFAQVSKLEASKVITRTECFRLLEFDLSRDVYVKKMYLQQYNCIMNNDDKECLKFSYTLRWTASSEPFGSQVVEVL